MAQFTIRIPDEVRDGIKAAASEDRRTLNGEVEWLLWAALFLRDQGALGQIQKAPARLATIICRICAKPYEAPVPSVVAAQQLCNACWVRVERPDDVAVRALLAKIEHGIDRTAGEPDA